MGYHTVCVAFCNSSLHQTKARVFKNKLSNTSDSPPLHIVCRVIYTKYQYHCSGPQALFSGHHSATDGYLVSTYTLHEELPEQYI